MDNSNLTAEEQAYFDSRGETAPAPAEKEAAPPPEAVEEVEETDVGVADEGGDDLEDQPRQSMVPHKALHAEREKRKALERELQEAREFRIRFEERQKYLAEMDAQRAKQPEPEPEKVPDPDEDVFSATRYALKETEALKRQIAEQNKAQTEDMRRRDMALRTQAMETEFRKVNPDYDDAVNHLRTVRERELAAFGVNDPAERAVIVQQEAWQIASRALQIGKSPAEIAYEIAKTRGWQSKVAQVAEDGDERTEQAKARSKSLWGVGGGPAAGQMTGERLLKMSPQEFAAYERKNPATVRRLLGG